MVLDHDPKASRRILRRVRDVAEVRHQGVITSEVSSEALELLEVDGHGLERTDRALLNAMAGFAPEALPPLGSPPRAIGYSTPPPAFWTSTSRLKAPSTPVFTCEI